jgi:hypothetical protein
MKQKSVIETFEDGEINLGTFSNVKTYDRMKSRYLNQLTDVIRNYEKIIEEN